MELPVKSYCSMIKHPTLLKGVKKKDKPTGKKEPYLFEMSRDISREHGAWRKAEVGWRKADDGRPAVAEALARRQRTEIRSRRSEVRDLAHYSLA
jgi:hypothetical protein